MELSNKEIYEKIKKELIGKEGKILFQMNNDNILIDSSDIIGNILQDYFKNWFIKNDIDCFQNPMTQEFPDFFNGKNKQYLEIKSFNINNGPGFDIANFYSYLNKIKENENILNADYLVIAYSYKDSILKIENAYLKKIWELTGSGKYPLSLQVKYGKVYAIRPITFNNSNRTFTSKTDFVKALYEVEQIFNDK